MPAEQIKFIFRHRSFVKESAIGIQTVLAKHGLPLTGFKLFGKRIRVAQLPAELDKMEYPGFNLVGQEFDFTGGSVANRRLDFLLAKSISVPRISWDDWASQFIGSQDFIMAWIADSEYDHWQNARTQQEFALAGRPYLHLPLKPTGRPYPCDQFEIDRSANPGRWSFHDGYIEAVGSTMWLGEPFWQLTGANREQVASTAWLKQSNPAPSVLRIQAAEHCFTAADGASGELQNNLRALLFPPK